MQLKFKGCGLQRAIGYWAFAVLCGSAAAACSGTIETPSEENPRAEAIDDEDDGDAPAAPRAPANSGNNAAANDDDEDAPVVPADDEDEVETPAAPAADEDDEELPVEEPPVAAGGVTFANDVYPIWTASCGPCHTSGSSGGQSIGSDDLDTALQDSRDFEEEVIAELESGDMPLGCGAPPGGGGTCISEEDFEVIQDWYAAGAPE